MKKFVKSHKVNLFLAGCSNLKPMCNACPSQQGAGEVKYVFVAVDQDHLPWSTLSKHPLQSLTICLYPQQQIPYYTEAQFTSFSSAGFTIAEIVNPPNEKLINPISVHCTGQDNIESQVRPFSHIKHKKKTRKSAYLLNTKKEGPIRITQHYYFSIRVLQGTSEFINDDVSCGIIVPYARRYNPLLI